MADKVIMPYYEIQHYLSFDGEETWVKVTEDRSMSPSRNVNEYATQYLDRRNQATYALGMSDSLAFEVDAVGPEGIQKFLAQHEDAQNVPVSYMRTLGYDFQAGKAAPAAARVAKKAAGVMNSTPMTGELNNPGVFHASVSLTGEYVAGTFNETTGAFSEGSAAQGA